MLNDNPSQTFLGIQHGDFKAVRFNEAGYRDSALNPTLDLQTTTTGDTTTVTVSIDDSNPMFGVAMNLHYDTSKYTPLTTSFSGLVAEPIELSVVKGDYVALAQASLAGAAQRRGEFVTVTFQNSPNKTASASGDAHQVAVDAKYDAAQLAVANHLDGFMLTKSTAEDGSPATAMVHGIFAVGDGDQNGESNSADLVPMVALQWFNEAVSDTNFAPAVADYDHNGEVGSADMVPLGQHLGEVTASIDFLLGDDDTFATTDAAAFSMNFADGTYDSPTPGQAITDWDAVYRMWEPEFTLAQLQAADTNADGTVYVSARAANTSGVGPAFTGLPLTYTVINDNFIITGIEGEIDGAATTPVADGGTLNVLANESLTLNVTGIAGTYDGTPFTPADHTAVPGTEYEDTLATIAATASWTTTLDAGMIATTAGVSNPATVAGTGQTVVIFPDDDPDYGAGTPEGTLVGTIPAVGTQIPAALTFTMDVEVETDPVVPIITEIYSDQGEVGGGNWYLNPVGETFITAKFNFGSLVIAEADFVDMSVQLFDLDGGPAVDLTVVTAGSSLDQGQAEIREDSLVPGLFVMTGVVGINLIAGHTYGVRLAVPDGADTWWTSINKPGEFFEVAPLPAPQDFVSMPGENEVGPVNNSLWIYYPDPRIRRNPEVTFMASTIEPADPDGYKDIVKDNGNEFALSSLGMPPDPVTQFPQVILIEGTSPDGITSTTENFAGVGVVERTPNYIVVDIAVLTPEGMGGTTHYAYKAFGAAVTQASWPELGGGLFNVAPMDVSPAAVAGVDFGIDIFSGSGRGDLGLNARDFSSKNLNGSTILTNTPNVLFVEFNGGRSDDLTGTSNVSLIFEDLGSSARMTVPLSIRAVGIGMDGLNRIGIRDFILEDFDNPSQAGWPGILDPGHTYSLILDSPLQPGSDDFTFLDGVNPIPLVVTGTNPNI